MPADLVITPRLTIPAGELSMAFARSGGPGGQNVNKVSSKVELRWNPTTSLALGDDDRAWLVQRLRSGLDIVKGRRAHLLWEFEALP